MGTLRPPSQVTGPTLDVQVLEGLETYITTEKFLHTLEAASAEWIDLCEHQHQPHKPGQVAPGGLEMEMLHVPSAQQQCVQQSDAAPTQPAVQPYSSSGSSSFFSRWRKSSSDAGSSSPSNAASSSSAQEAMQPSPAAHSSTQDTSSSSIASDSAAVRPGCDALPAVVAATTTFELVEPQAPLTESLMQEPFVLVSSEDAIAGMAYYIALYLSRAPEARYMEPKQLQAALRQTFTAIRRSRYRVIWDWGRCLYRWGAVSYSALQLYEHPWLVRAVVAGVWASSKMAVGILF